MNIFSNKKKFFNKDKIKSNNWMSTNSLIKKGSQYANDKKNSFLQKQNDILNSHLSMYWKKYEEFSLRCKKFGDFLEIDLENNSFSVKKSINMSIVENIEVVSGRTPNTCGEFCYLFSETILMDLKYNKKYGFEIEEFNDKIFLLHKESDELNEYIDFNNNVLYFEGIPKQAVFDLIKSRKKGIFPRDLTREGLYYDYSDGEEYEKYLEIYNLNYKMPIFNGAATVGENDVVLFNGEEASNAIAAPAGLGEQTYLRIMEALKG